MYDGGVRSLALMSGGRVPAAARGTRFAGLLHVVDLTAAMLAEAQVLPLKREVLELDGESLLRNILYFEQRDVGRWSVPINILHGGSTYSAVRFGKYKVVFDQAAENVRPSQGWYDANGDLLEAPPLATEQPVRVYDLEADPQERADLSQSEPWAIEHGRELLQAYVLGGRYHEPQSAALHPGAFPGLHAGTWSPFMTRARWERQLAREWGLHDDDDHEVDGDEDDARVALAHDAVVLAVA